MRRPSTKAPRLRRDFASSCDACRVAGAGTSVSLHFQARVTALRRVTSVAVLPCSGSAGEVVTAASETMFDRAVTSDE